MKDFDNLCSNCFEELTSGSVCSACGYDNDTEVDMTYLSPKTILNDRYVVGAVIEHESDAVVYSGYDTQLNAKINIREFLPQGIANRLEGNNEVHIRERYRADYEKYKASFVKLWTTIVKMHNLSAVVPAYDVFELNGTAYAICEEMEYISLRDFLLKAPEGNIAWEDARLMFMPVLTTIETLHSNGIIHGAICPDTLVLCRDGRIRLKGFSISEANVQLSGFKFNEHTGYTALEQYDNNNHKLCKATDIYAFSACIFRALVGQNPPDARQRELNDKLMIPNSIAEKIPTHIIKALGGGLQVYPEKRTQSVEQFRELLNASPSVVAASAPISDDDDPVTKEEHYRGYPEYDDKSKGRTSKAIIIILVVLIIAAVCAGVYVVKSGVLNKPEETTAAPEQLASYTVPDFISAGYTQSDIQNNGAWNQQFKFTYKSEFSVEAEEGVIFKQSIKAGETVEQGTEIELTVSKGVETAEVPDVASMTLEQATKTLKEAGFAVSTVEVYNDGEFVPNTVKGLHGMAPKAGSVVALGEEIILQVYGEIQTTDIAENDDNPDEE